MTPPPSTPPPSTPPPSTPPPAQVVVTAALPQGKWHLWHTVVSLAIVVAVIALAIWAATSDTLVTDAQGRLPLWTFLVLAALLAAFSLLMGWGITGEVAGVLIDPKRHRMSLSQLQTLVWTILILAAYLNAFVVNISADRDDPLIVAIPGELLIVMGISLSSLAGAKIVLGAKQTAHGTATEEADGSVTVERDDGVAPTGEDVRSAVLRGVRPQWRDVFLGDTTEGSATLDLGKVQMFYITIALVVGYGIEVATQFVGVSTGATGGIPSLPAIDEGFIALLAISHAGYLTTKAAS